MALNRTKLFICTPVPPTLADDLECAGDISWRALRHLVRLGCPRITFLTSRLGGVIQAPTPANAFRT